MRSCRHIGRGALLLVVLALAGCGGRSPSPNLVHDMHDSDVAMGDAWLQRIEDAWGLAPLRRARTASDAWLADLLGSR